MKVTTGVNIKKICVIGVIPPMHYNEPIPVYYTDLSATDWCNGTFEERKRFVTKLNKLCKDYCETHDYTYFAPYEEYTAEDGSLKPELSDGICHIGDSTIFLKRFQEDILEGQTVD